MISIINNTLVKTTFMTFLMDNILRKLTNWSHSGKKKLWQKKLWHTTKIPRTDLREINKKEV